MSSTYCIDCEKEAGDNWSECYFCGGKNLRKLENISYYPQESNSVTSNLLSFMAIIVIPLEILLSQRVQ